MSAGCRTFVKYSREPQRSIHAMTVTSPSSESGSAHRRPTKAVITTTKLSKTFSVNGNQQHVLKNLDMTIGEGEFVTIMGPSGAGKSTLLYALSGMDRPTLGDITFADTCISGYSPDQLARFRRTHCGFVFQQIHLLDWLTVFDNAMTAGLLSGAPRKDVTKEAHRLFDQVGLDAKIRQKFPSMLSGGEAQRAALVRALVSRPDVLFADEPTGQLNSNVSRMVLDLMSEISAGGQTIVMVTHEVRSAVRGERILYLRDGQIQGELQLGRWSDEDTNRQPRLTNFLTQMGW